MAKFIHLPNELIIAMVSYIRKPADILQLCIAERRIHQLILPLLYENIVFHYLDYPTREQYSLYSKVFSLCRLFKQQQQNGKSGDRHSPDFGGVCRSLAISMHNSMGCPTTNVLDLFSFLPFLRNLSLICSRRRTDYKSTFTFHVGKLGRVLHPLRDTLETLALFIGRQDDYCSEDGIGSLHRFKAMKQLRIQSHVLLGSDWHGNADSGLLLSQLLPPNLEDLTIHCCVVECIHSKRKMCKHREGEIAHHYEAPLDGEESTRSFKSSQHLTGRDRRVIESVVVCMLQKPKTAYSLYVTAHRLSRLESCFDIVGRRRDSADE